MMRLYWCCATAVCVKIMQLVLRVKGNSSGRDSNVLSVNGGEIKLSSSDTTYKFDTVLNEGTTQQSLFDYVVKPELETHLFKNEDCLVLGMGTKSSGRGYTLIGDQELGNMDGIVARSLQMIFDRIPQERLASFKNLSKLLGNSIAGSRDLAVGTGTLGVTLSIFELHEDNVRDLLANKDIKQNSTSIVKDPKDGKIRPNGLMKFHVISLEQAMESVQLSLSRRRNLKRHYIIQINLHELKRFGRHQTTRLTLLKVGALEHQLQQSNEDLLKILRSLRKNETVSSSSIKTSSLNKIIFADMVNLNKINTTAILTIDPQDDMELLQNSMDIMMNSVITRPKRIRNLTPILSNRSDTTTVSKLEQLQLEVQETQSKCQHLEMENRQLTENLLSIEQQTRLDISNRYEQMIDKMTKDNMTAKIDDDETHQLNTDAKLENLALHYDMKLEIIKKENAKLRLQLENLQYQNTTMDKIFHVELEKVGNTIREEYEEKLKEEIARAEAQRVQLNETNEMLDQKVQLLQSQVNILKEKAGRDTEEAEQLYNKIKLLRLDDEVLMLINKKMKTQSSKERPQKNLKSKKKSGVLLTMNLDPKKFTIYEDSHSGGKRKLARKDDILIDDMSDLEMG